VRMRCYTKWMVGGVPVIPLILLVVGISLIAGAGTLLHHWSALHSECQTAIGQFGRALDSQVQHSCNEASLGVLLGWVLGATGMIGIVGGSVLARMGVKRAKMRAALPPSYGATPFSPIDAAHPGYASSAPTPTPAGHVTRATSDRLSFGSPATWFEDEPTSAPSPEPSRARPAPEAPPVPTKLRISNPVPSAEAGPSPVPIPTLAPEPAISPDAAIAGRPQLKGKLAPRTDHSDG
jgi:hypothetical protein